jgi:hypothetical protein
MKSTPSTTPNDHGRWTVEFHELRDIQQHPAVRNLNRGTVSAVLGLWLKIITPGAKIIEQGGSTTWTIIFLTRSRARHFVACFGGKLISRSSP